MGSAAAAGRAGTACAAASATGSSKSSSKPDCVSPEPTLDLHDDSASTHLAAARASAPGPIEQRELEPPSMHGASHSRRGSGIARRRPSVSVELVRVDRRALASAMRQYSCGSPRCCAASRSGRSPRGDRVRARRCRAAARHEAPAHVRRRPARPGRAGSSAIGDAVVAARAARTDVLGIAPASISSWTGSVIDRCSLTADCSGRATAASPAPPCAPALRACAGR